MSPVASSTEATSMTAAPRGSSAGSGHTASPGEELAQRCADQARGRAAERRPWRHDRDRRTGVHRGGDGRRGPHAAGDPYKPSAIRNYEQGLRLRIIPALGPSRLADVRTADLQRLVRRWQAKDVNPSTIRNTMNALRGAVPAGRRPRRLSHEPDAGSHASRRPRQARQDRTARGRRAARRRARVPRTRAVGDRLRGRSAQRRAAGSRVGERRPGSPHHHRRQRLGPLRG
jgi:Phage integrase, N-terminal SAM-like domain